MSADDVAGILERLASLEARFEKECSAREADQARIADVSSPATFERHRPPIFAAHCAES